MRNSEHYASNAFAIVHEDDPELVYANDVQIMAEPGGLQLTFLRPRPVGDEIGRSSHDRDVTNEVIARVVLPPVAARRLLRLLPRRLDLQRALADEYDRVTETGFEGDPFLAAHADAEYDDEPYTDEEKAIAQAGWEEYQRGETVPWEEFRRELLKEDEASTTSAP